MKGFLNKFVVKKPVKKLQTYEVKYNPNYDSDTHFGYKIASHLSRKLTDEVGIPIASSGRLIIADRDLTTSKVFTVTIKINGVPTDVEVSISKKSVIQEGDEGFEDAAKRFLNRQIDLLMSRRGYEQDGRCFYEKRACNISKYYRCYDGLYIASQIEKNGEQTVVVDPVTQVRNRLNLLEALNVELKRRGIEHWRDARGLENEINRLFRSKAHSIRSTYVEIRRDAPQHNVYRFLGFDFSKPLKVDSDHSNPVNFHRKYGRKFSLDQPTVEVLAKGGYRINHIPELLEERATMRMLKRFGASEEIQTRSLMDSKERYYTTTELVQPLQTEEFIEQLPISVDIDEFAPVIITVEGDYIEIKNNFDFQKIFKKRKLLRKPQIERIYLFSTKDDSEQAERLITVLSKIFKDFKIDLPEIVKHKECPNELEGFKTFILDKAKEKQFDKKDLVLVVFGLGDEDLEDVIYNSIKKQSISKPFPVQFINTRTIENVKDNKDLRTEVVNLLFLQIVAKCGGDPYGLRPGFVPSGTLFIGIDKYRDPFKKNPPTITTVVLFDSDGSYACCKSKITKTDEEISLHSVISECIEKYRSLKKREEVKTVIYLVDTGIGTKIEQLSKDAMECEKAASEIGSSYIFVTANKGSHLRLYKGDPSKPLTASRVSSFSAVTQMRDHQEILVVSTEPIVSKKLKRELGTPRPVLYNILSCSKELNLEKWKETLAKSIIWLCKDSWISPGSTRLPAPLFFANKISRLTSDTGVPMEPDKVEIPLFL